MITRTKRLQVRDRILRRLNAAASFPIVLIIAPAGYGKTTAVHHLLDQFERPMYIRTPRSATLRQFVFEFSRVLSTNFPSMQNPPDEPPDENPTDTIELEIYTAWALRHLADVSFTIAIDDLQNAFDNHLITEFIRNVAEATASNSDWIIASRTNGSLPVNQWQAYGFCDAPIDATDLKMTIDDAVSFAEAVQCPITLPELKKWIAQTNGFTVPMTYAIRLSARRGSTHGIMDGARTVTFDFLAEQLWASLTTDEKRFLLISSHMPPLHIHEYELIGLDDASSLILKLCSDIAFLEIDNFQRFSMHDLFRDYLQHEILFVGARERKKHTKAAFDLLFLRKDFDAAFEILLKSSDTEEIYLAVEQMPTNFRLDPSITRQVIEKIDNLLIADVPISVVVLAMEYWFWIGDNHRTRFYANELLARPEASSHNRICALRTFLNRGQVDKRDCLDLLNTFSETLSDEHKLEAMAYTSSIRALDENTREESIVSLRNIQARSQHLDPTIQVNIQTTAAYAYYLIDDLPAAVKAVRLSVDLAISIGDVTALARTLNNLILTLIAARDTEAANFFVPLQKTVEENGIWRFSQGSHYIPAVYYAWHGRKKAAEEALELQSRAISHNRDYANITELQQQGLNLYRLLVEDYTGLIADFPRMNGKTGPTWNYSALCEVSIAFALTGERGRALATIRHADIIRSSLTPTHLNGVPEAIHLEIIARSALGTWSEANRLLERYSKQTEQFAAVEFALNRLSSGPPFAGLEEALNKIDDRPYQGLIAILARRVRDFLNPQKAPKLTIAEAEILQLLAMGKSNREIASARGRSEDTVKRQLASIYRKLGVSNRTEASAVSREFKASL